MKRAINLRGVPLPPPPIDERGQDEISQLMRKARLEIETRLSESSLSPSSFTFPILASGQVQAPAQPLPSCWIVSEPDYEATWGALPSIVTDADDAQHGQQVVIQQDPWNVPEPVATMPELTGAPVSFCAADDDEAHLDADGLDDTAIHVAGKVLAAALLVAGLVGAVAAALHGVAAWFWPAG